MFTVKRWFDIWRRLKHDRNTIINIFDRIYRRRLISATWPYIIWIWAKYNITSISIENLLKNNSWIKLTNNNNNNNPKFAWIFKWIINIEGEMSSKNIENKTLKLSNHNDEPMCIMSNSMRPDEVKRPDSRPAIGAFA